MQNKFYKSAYEFFKPFVAPVLIAICTALLTALTTLTVLRNDVTSLAKQVQANENEHNGFVTTQIFGDYETANTTRQNDIIHRLDIISNRLDSLIISLKK